MADCLILCSVPVAVFTCSVLPHLGKTMRAHLRTGRELTERKALDTVRSQPFVIIADESSKRVEMMKQSVTVIVCRTFQVTVLLDVVVDTQSSSGQLVCDFVRTAVEKAQLNMSACRGLMGDNVRYMGKAARLLDVQRLRCIPHGLSLVAGVFMQASVVNDLVSTWKNFITMGNTGARRLRLQAATGVSAAVLDVAPTRWGSWLDAVEALVNNWHKLKDAVQAEEASSSTKRSLLEQMSNPVCYGVAVAINKSTELIRQLIVVSQGMFSVLVPADVLTNWHCRCALLLFRQRRWPAAVWCRAVQAGLRPERPGRSPCCGPGVVRTHACGRQLDD